MKPLVVAAFYSFFANDDLDSKKNLLLELFKSQSIFGTIILASEGFNGTVCSSQEAIDDLKKILFSWSQNVEWKISFASEMPFKKQLVKIKPEIVTLRAEVPLSPGEKTGEYISFDKWNDVISDPNAIVIDTRNDFEVQLGAFKNAINPKTTSFPEFKDFVDKELVGKEKSKIAMYCTGGIRCEKSTAYLLARGFEDVCHLKGGILRYLEETKKEDSLWQGDCYVFDERRVLNHNSFASDLDK